MLFYFKFTINISICAFRDDSPNRENAVAELELLSQLRYKVFRTARLREVRRQRQEFDGSDRHTDTDQVRGFASGLT